MTKKALTAEDIDAAFNAVTVPRSQKKCAIGNLIEEYPGLESKIMDVEHYSGATISQVLRRLGVSNTADTTVNKHRKGLCRCPKETS
jgi:hypothetical protein